MKKRTIEDINKRIASGEAVIATVDEIINLAKKEGAKEAFERVDVVTAATFGPMCSSGAFLNFGHSNPQIRMEKISLNGVEASGGLAAVDTYIGATQESATEGIEYGGAHVISDLVAGKSVRLKASGKGTDCYPRRELEGDIRLEDLNEAYIYNPRNCYQNYAAATNTSGRTLRTYMGTLLPNLGNVNYSTAGQLSPLLKDPYYRTIGIGTKIFLGGGEGFVAWQGTQFNSAAPREANGIPKGTAGTLALIGDLKGMNSKYVRPAVFEGYGVSLNIGVGIPIPLIDFDLMESVLLTDDEIFTNVLDYSVQERVKPVIARVSYGQLRTGAVEIEGKTVKTAPISSLKLSHEIAAELKSWIESGRFTLTNAVKALPQDNAVKPLNL